MKSIFVAIISLCFLTPAFTQDIRHAKPTVADLIIYTIQNGVHQDDTPLGDYRTLTNIVKTEKGHMDKYFSVVGGTVDDKFIPLEFVVQSEDWVKDDAGNWDIDQWIFTFPVQGGPGSIMHINLQETPTGTVLKDNLLPADLGDISVQHIFVHLGNEWLAKIDIGSAM